MQDLYSLLESINEDNRFTTKVLELVKEYKDSIHQNDYDNLLIIYKALKICPKVEKKESKNGKRALNIILYDSEKLLNNDLTVLEQLNYDKLPIFLCAHLITILWVKKNLINLLKKQ